MIENKRFVSFLVILVILLLDQFSKWYVKVSNILPIYFNNNVGFSLPIAWYIPWIGIVGVVTYLFFKKKNLYSFVPKSNSSRLEMLLYVAISFIVAGGIGNVIDRIIYNGSVIDFIDLKFWPIFNIADISIVIGALMFVLYYYKVSKLIQIKD
ncbi:MAG: signal peptidase II [bacterium]|nr:signal peptidase II [bacterium]